MHNFPSDPEIHSFLAIIYMDSFLRDPSVKLSTVKKELKVYLSKNGKNKSRAKNYLNLIRSWQIGTELFMDPFPWEEIFTPGKFIGGMIISAFWNMVIRFLLSITSIIFSHRLNQSNFDLLLKSSISESDLFE